MQPSFDLHIRSKKTRRLFLEVWAGLPEEAREKISVALFLATDEKMLNPRLRLRRADARSILAAVDLGLQTHIWLNARRISHIREDRVKAAIAHEFAHVYLDHFQNASAAALDYPSRENNEADKQAAAWGFPKLGAPACRAVLETADFSL